MKKFSVTGELLREYRQAKRAILIGAMQDENAVKP
jgi:hypothetical protein